MKLLGALYGRGDEAPEDENPWTFIQLLPLLSLLVPLLNAVFLFASGVSWRRPISSQSAANPREGQSASQHQDSSTSNDISIVPQPPAGDTSVSKTSEKPSEDHLKDTDLENVVRHGLSKEYYYNASWMFEILLSLGIFSGLIAGHFFYSTTELATIITGGPIKMAGLDQVQFWIIEQGALFYCLVSIPVASAWSILIGFHLGPWLSRNKNSTLGKLAMFLLAVLIHLLYILFTFGASIYDGLGINIPAVFSFFDNQLKMAQGKAFLLLTGVLYTLHAIGCLVSFVTHGRPQRDSRT